LTLTVGISLSPRYATHVASSFWRRTDQTHSSMTAEDFDFFYRQIRAVVDPAPAERLVDYGCGEGSIALAFQRDGFNIVGIDISEHFVTRGREVGLECYRVEEFFAHPATYSVIFAAQSFFYIHPRRRALC
jgi:2-polyprenyl-3-methyl-5-hydroxy-6-metoxy-1,4-benzoquinol methylase